MPPMSGSTTRPLRTCGRLLGCSEDYAIVFMGGGAQAQFALVPMNLLTPGAFAEYLVTGVWSATALHEASKIGAVRSLWSSADTAYDRVPGGARLCRSRPQAAYLHYTSNNTIVGTQYHDVPESGDVPLVCDMSSDLLSRPLAMARFGLHLCRSAEKCRACRGDAWSLSVAICWSAAARTCRRL